MAKSPKRKKKISHNDLNIDHVQMYCLLINLLFVEYRTNSGRRIDPKIKKFVKAIASLSEEFYPNFELSFKNQELIEACKVTRLNLEKTFTKANKGFYKNVKDFISSLEAAEETLIRITRHSQSKKYFRDAREMCDVKETIKNEGAPEFFSRTIIAKHLNPNKPIDNAGVFKLLKTTFPKFSEESIVESFIHLMKYVFFPSIDKETFALVESIVEQNEIRQIYHFGKHIGWTEKVIFDLCSEKLKSVDVTADLKDFLPALKA